MDRWICEEGWRWLGIKGRRRTSAVVAKEAVQACAIDEDILRIQHAKRPAVSAGAIAARAVGGEVRVTQGGDGSEGDWRRRVGLVVGRLSLDLGHEDVFGVVELVLVECVVLDCRADTVW
jgi:hypothetical protein